MKRLLLVAALAILASPANAAYLDQWNLSQSATFQNRVAAALFSTCVSIGNEGWAIPFHRERASFAAQILSGVGGQSSYVTLFTNSVSTDPTVISDATQAGTVSITSTNVATQEALVTDAHIAAAISAEFNDYIRVPGN